MFPGPGATIYRNEAGEPLGWDYPAEPEYDPYDDDLRDDDRYQDQHDDFIDGLLDRHEHVEGAELDEVHRLMRENDIDDPDPTCQEQP